MSALFTITNIVTDSIQHSSFVDANSRSTSQEFLRFIWYISLFKEGAQTEGV
jgi:hypothetical protein